MSCQHRSTALHDAAALTDTVISNIVGHDTGGELNSSTIKQAAVVALNRFDKVASTYYSAFHKG
jgi:hypothetical protein